MTHTYVLLEVTPATFAEVKAKLEAAGYDHAFQLSDGKQVIDMHGIALVSGPASVPCEDCIYCPACTQHHKAEA